MDEAGAEEETKTGTEILTSQIEAVQNFGRERIFSPEKRKQIVEAVTNGLDLIASTIKEEAQETGLSWDAITPLMEWTMADFTRTALTTPPLPPQSFEEAAPGGLIADLHDWWQVLSDGQKNALWDILEQDFGLIRGLKREPIPFLPSRGKGYTIGRSERIVTVPAARGYPENQFQPGVVFDPARKPCYLTCFVVK